MSIKNTETKQKALNFLKRNPMGVLSTVSEDGKPWGSAVYYVAEDDFTCYFVTRSGTRKYQNIEQNPAVALTVADSDDQVTVQLAGTLSAVPSKDIIDVVFKKLAHVKPAGDTDWLPPVIKVHNGDWMILSLTPNRVQYADFKQHKTEVSDSYIETIL